MLFRSLDYSRPVPAALVQECIDIAIQAPTGSNQQGWSFVVVTDAAKKKALADLYRKGFELYAQMPRAERPALSADDARRLLATCKNPQSPVDLRDFALLVLPVVSGGRIGRIRRHCRSQHRWWSTVFVPVPLLPGDSWSRKIGRAHV